MIGADGAHSVVRNQLTRVIRCGHIWERLFILTFSRMDYAQEYIPHAYLELSIPPGPIDPESGEPSFLLDPNHLHIWPRQSFMLIALPNQVCLFALYIPRWHHSRITHSLAPCLLRLRNSPSWLIIRTISSNSSVRISQTHSNLWVRRAQRRTTSIIQKDLLSQSRLVSKLLRNSFNIQ